MANMIFVGPPGAGKETQAARLAVSRKVMSIRFSALVRDALQAETQLGRDTRDAVESGQLVPDNVLIGLVEERLTADAGNRGYVLSGIARTIQQAERLQDMLSRIGKLVDLAIFFDLTVEVMISRLLRISPALRGNQVHELEIGY
jgi:adenylate kinase